MTPKDKREKSVNDLLTTCNAFFAFGQKQFTEGIQKLRDSGALLEGEKVTQIYGGGYIPSKMVEVFELGMESITREFKDAMRDKKARHDHIVYELWNHERNVESTMDALGDDFGADEILAVAKSNRIKTH